MQFSARSQRVVESFAANMGITAQPAPDNSYGFEFTRSGVLSIAPSQDGSRIVVFLAQDGHEVDPIFHDKFPRLAGPHLPLGLMLHAAMGENGSVVLATSIDETDFTLQLLDQTISALIDALASIQTSQP